MLYFALFWGLVACATSQRFNLTVVDSKLEVPLRIVNGVEAKRHEFPFIARLTVIWSDGGGLCGGSLINQNHVLTAAHCFYHPETNEFAKQVQVFLGDHNRKAAEPGRITLSGINVMLDGYNQDTSYNDIALIELDRSVSYTNEIQPICLDQAGSTHVGQTATAAGWGALGTNQPTSDVLRKVQIPILADSQCSGYQFFNDVMLCGGYTDGSKDTCQGDSGGPLFLSSGNGFTLVGATSFGYGCAAPGYPGVYTRISHFTDWVRESAGSFCTH